jgi:hypothetical protein
VVALKHVTAINVEQYNKLSVKCAFVCSLYILFKKCVKYYFKLIISMSVDCVIRVDKGWFAAGRIRLG